jgi:hypothetical protein
MDNINYRYFLYQNDAILYGKAFSDSYSLVKEVFPVNGQDVKYKSEYETNQIFKRKKLLTELIFAEDIKNGINDFSFLFGKLEAGYFCYEYRLKVQRLCGRTWTDYWEGYFSLSWGKWDQDQCKYSVLPEVNDKYRCLLDAAKDDFNLLDITNIKSLVVPNNIQLEYITCAQITVSGIATSTSPCLHVNASFGSGKGPPLITSFGCITPGQGWMLYSSTYTAVATIPVTVEIESTWVREVLTTLDVGGQPNPPAGAGWVQLNATTINGKDATKWARMPYNGAFQTYTVTLHISPCYVTFVWEAPGVTTTHTRCRPLSDIMYMLFGQCGNTIRSDIFDVNSPQNNSINYVTGEINKLRFILVEQKSDALKPTASQGATIGNMNLAGLIDVLRNTWNCYWDIINGEVRIEHLSYFQRNNGLDLTAANYKNQILSTNKYYYSLKDLPKYERWAFKDSGGIDFVGTDIIYLNVCVNQEAGTNIAQYTVDLVCTDIDYIQRNPDDLSKDGFVFYSCYLISNQYILNQDAGKLTGDVQLNGHFSTANLLDAYHRYGRVLNHGIMNGLNTDFLSYKRYKFQNSFSIKLCCDTPFNDQEFVKTFMGWGEVHESEFSTKSSTLTLTLKHL